MAEEQAQAGTGTSRVNTEKARASLGRLYAMYEDMAAVADQVMQKRCPYKDAKSHCTAKFGCRNQFFTSDPTDLPVCAGSDRIDYRDAWDT
ncbi:MAG: hypothetical protein QF357_02245 [Dehalococcoidia bacterium]|nr:hypothetical protein [Dehalococcoidia bacterium]